jgi:hypothetical protein
MRVLSLVVLITGVLAAPASLSAAGPAGRANPYTSLFTGRLEVQSTRPPLTKPTPLPRQPGLPSAQTPTIVCGMTIVPSDAKIDQRILVPAPTRGVTPSIRIITPTICR